MTGDLPRRSMGPQASGVLPQLVDGPMATQTGHVQVRSFQTVLQVVVVVLNRTNLNQWS